MSFPCSNVLRLSECVLLFLIFEIPIFILVYAREVMSWRVCLQLLEKFGDITGVIINYNSKDRQFNGYKTTQKTKYFSNTKTTKKPDTLLHPPCEYCLKSGAECRKEAIVVTKNVIILPSSENICSNQIILHDLSV